MTDQLVDSAGSASADDNAASSTDEETGLGNDANPTGFVEDTESEDKTADGEQEADAGVIQTEKTQKRFDDLTRTIRDRDATIERLLTKAPLEFVDKGEPKSDDFEDDSEYAAALGEYRSTKNMVSLINQNQDRESKANDTFEIEQKLTTYNERAAEVTKVHKDFYQVTSASLLKTTDRDGNILPITAAILELENGPEVMYHISTNPTLASDLNRAGPVVASMTAQRLSNQLSAQPKRTPPDVEPVGSEDTGQGAGAANDGLKNIDGATFT